MDVGFGTASPLLAAGNQFQFDHSLGSEKGRYFSVGILRSEWHKDSHGLLQRGQHFRPAHNLRKVRRANFFFAFSYQNKVDRQFAAGAADGVQRSQKRGFRTLLIDRATSDDYFAEARLVDNARLPRR